MVYNRGLFPNLTLPPGGKSGGDEAQLKKIFSEIRGGIKIGRVTDIILNGSYPNIEEYGGVSSIGTIFFELNGKIKEGEFVAAPFFPQMSSYPLVNEMVLIFNLPNKNIGKTIKNKSYFYINIISLWNHPHHNAYPNPTSPSTPNSHKNNHQVSKTGIPNLIPENSNLQTTIFNSQINPSQATFEERSNIHPLLPFAGDVIYQGRWGNSIRFGSTANPAFSTNPSFYDKPEDLNSWSDNVENGDPITIIRNGQSPEESDEGWVPITENVNDDLSSIYCTSTQKIPIEVINKNYSSYSNGPDFPTSTSQYTKPQVIINSDRLVFNAKKDHILLSSEKSIFLGSNSSINFSTKKWVIDSRSIRLGSKEATEPLILGEKFLGNLEVILDELSLLCGEIGKLKDWKIANLNTGVIAPSAANNGNLASIANNLQKMIRGGDSGFLDQIDTYKSKVSKTL